MRSRWRRGAAVVQTEVVRRQGNRKRDIDNVGQRKDPVLGAHTQLVDDHRRPQRIEKLERVATLTLRPISDQVRVDRGRVARKLDIVHRPSRVELEERDGSEGVDGTFAVEVSPLASESRTASVNVPPMSTPSRKRSLTGGRAPAV